MDQLSFLKGLLKDIEEQESLIRTQIRDSEHNLDAINSYENSLNLNPRASFARAIKPEQTRIERTFRDPLFESNKEGFNRIENGLERETEDDFVPLESMYCIV